jgi:hypothetical protein
MLGIVNSALLDIPVDAVPADRPPTPVAFEPEEDIDVT